MWHSGFQMTGLGYELLTSWVPIRCSIEQPLDISARLLVAFVQGKVFSTWRLLRMELCDVLWWLCKKEDWPRAYDLAPEGVPWDVFINGECELSFLLHFFSWMKLCISEVQFFFFALSGMLRDKFFCDQSNRHIWKELLKEGAQEKKYASVSNSIGKLFYLDSVYSDMASLPYKLPLKLYSAIYF